MITGFNTDIERDGVTYHVQTEDKGLETPLLLSLVYSGGAILASKRSRYDDLVASGFDEKILAERLQRQHKLICAAIRAGRIEELKIMSQREAGVRAAQKAEAKEQQTPSPSAQSSSEPVIARTETPAKVETPAKSFVTPRPPAPPVVNKPKAPQPLPHKIEQAAPAIPFTPPSTLPPARQSQPPIASRPAPVSNFSIQGQDEAGDELNLELVEDRDFRAGDVVALRIRVSRGQGVENNGVPNAQVTVKVLGTTFRPLICSATTDRDGMAVVFTTLPRFTSGRAAILVRTIVGSQDAEMRRIILPA